MRRHIRQKGVEPPVLSKAEGLFNFGNKYDLLVIITIASLAWGNLDYLRAITPVRIMGCVGLYYGYKNWTLLIKNYKTWMFLVGLWFFYIVLSLAWTSDIKLGFTMLFHMCTMFGVFMLMFVASMRAERLLYSMTTGWILMVALTLPTAIWEITTFNHLDSGSFSEGLIDKEGEFKIFAAVTFQNYNSYVVMLSLAMPFIMLSFWQRNRYRWISVLVSGLMCFVLFVNASRGGLICLAITISVLYYEYAKRQKKIVVITQLSLASLFVIYYIIKNIDQLYVLHNIIVRFADYDADSVKSDSRLLIWGMGFEIAANHLFMGSGIGSMVAEYENIGRSEINYAHNFYLELLIEMGLVIFCLFFILVYSSLYRMKKITNNKRIRLLALHVALCSIFIFVIDDYYTVRSGAWVFVACVAAMPLWFRTRKSLS